MAAEPQAVLTSGRCPMPAGEPPQTRLRKEASPPRAASSRRGEVRAGLSPQQGLLPGQLSSSGRGVGLRASSLDGQPVLPLRATPHGGQDPGPWVSCKCPSPTLHMPQSPLRGTQADRQGSTWPGHGASRARTAGRGGGYPLREQISKLSPQHVGWRREPHTMEAGKLLIPGRHCPPATGEENADSSPVHARLPGSFRARGSVARQEYWNQTVSAGGVRKRQVVLSFGHFDVLAQTLKGEIRLNSHTSTEIVERD